MQTKNKSLLCLWKELTHVVYAESINKSMLERRGRDVKRGRIDEHQPRFKKRDPNQDVLSGTKDNYERNGGAKHYKPTWSNCKIKHFVKCLASSSGFYGCGMNYHKISYSPTIATRGTDVKQLGYNGMIVCELKNNQFYPLQANKEANLDESATK